VPLFNSLTPSGDSQGARLLVDEPSPGVALLTISNPGKSGAIDAHIINQLATTFAELEAGCVILTGVGNAFSSGCDLDQFASASTPDDAYRLVSEQFEPALELIAAYAYPTIAAINGHAIGAGLELALACDLRIGAADCRFGMPPAKLGLVYSRAGMRRFVDTIGAARTRELFLVGDPIDAATAMHWGLLHRLVTADELTKAASDLAEKVAAHAPLAQRGNKRVIDAVTGDHLPESDRTLDELRIASFRSQDFGEGVRAFAEKRAPRWSAR
jgi:enoyl-CoA hydratase/carnithine racemase